MPTTPLSVVRPILSSRGTAVTFAAALALAAFSQPAFSAQPTQAAQPAQTTPSTSSAKTLSLDTLEQRVTALGIRVKEMKVRGLLLKVEGRDAQHRKVELTLDRRTGEVLYRGFDD